ncbi:2-amino-4-hydroxy-6-hydroxymethyldihydropteridine diphosphokinase [bacterium]|nr:2-amino-4-hydroxy-6-hydroxymethyldihydropteridine diphosphokinase [bacterium]MBU1152706.1 2-amino-4-hydroxy-6-hydroxymethyldihydropteridine diphosphokinase [bacterium]
MPTVYISIGSNLDKERNITLCLFNLESSQEIKIKRLSNIYLTSPVGHQRQEDFLNFVAEINTYLTPLNLLLKLKKIEKKQEREYEIFWGPRTIDLDIIFYDHLVLEDDQLTIPHRHMEERDFVLKPLSELEPLYIHPFLNKSVRELLNELKEDGITLYGKWTKKESHWIINKT